MFIRIFIYDMLKQIPSSDISVRPFKVYKRFTATELDSGSGYQMLRAENQSGSSDVLTSTQLFQNGLWHQLKTMYYWDPKNPMLTYGDGLPTYSDNPQTQQRVLNDRAFVLTIPQKKYGEKIKPGSLSLTLTSTDEHIADDGYGNLVSDLNDFVLEKIDVETGLISFYDKSNTLQTINFYKFDMQSGVAIIGSTTNSIIIAQIDVTNSKVVFIGVITGGISASYFGNIIYQHGLIIITNQTADGELRSSLDTGGFELAYDSTNTIYENEYLIIVGEDEFNVSTNPSSVDFVNVTTSSISTTFEGIKKVTTYDAAVIKSDFASYEYSSSLDTTGSYLTPYITTIGLYDENMDMVAVAKLATPIKSMPDLPVNFLVRIDT